MLFYMKRSGSHIGMCNNSLQCLSLCAHIGYTHSCAWDNFHNKERLILQKRKACLVLKEKWSEKYVILSPGYYKGDSKKSWKIKRICSSAPANIFMLTRSLGHFVLIYEKLHIFWQNLSFSVAHAQLISNQMCLRWSGCLLSVVWFSPSEWKQSFYSPRIDKNVNASECSRAGSGFCFLQIHQTGFCADFFPKLLLTLCIALFDCETVYRVGVWEASTPSEIP